MITKKVAFIGGTGMLEAFQADGFELKEGRAEDTPYGGPVHWTTVRKEIQPGEVVEFTFISRHYSTGGFKAPHELVHQAYMYVLVHVLKVDAILASSAVGAIVESLHTNGLKPGDLIIPDQTHDHVLDPYTFMLPSFTHQGAFHRPLDVPFCPSLQSMLAGDQKIKRAGTLACSLKGPRFETTSEIATRRRDNITVVGMTTAFPEIVLAGEASVPYALICGVTNMAPADDDGKKVLVAMETMRPLIIDRVISAVYMIQCKDVWHKPDCPCRKGREQSVWQMIGADSK